MTGLGRYLVLRIVWRTLITAIRLGWRFTTGAPMDGKPKTNAGWLSRGDQVTTYALNGKALRWSYQPRLARAGWRFAVVILLAVQLYGVAGWPRLTLTLNVLALVALAVWGGFAIRRAWRTRTIRRTVIRPLAAAVQHRLSIREGAKTESWLSVPVDYRTNPEHPVVMALPLGFDREAHGEAVVRAALDRLRIAEPVIGWHNYGDAPRVTIASRTAPPEKVMLADVLSAIRAAGPSELVLGQGPGGRIVSVSLELDSPHIALSAPSNSGKSVAAGLAMAQQMARGAGSLIFDIKAESHTWAFNMRNAAVLTDVWQIHSGAVALWDEVTRRQQAVKNAAKAGQPRPEFPRIWAVFEELNITRRALKEVWDAYRAEDPERAKRLPKVSPALIALGNISFAGRSVSVHAILVAQRLTAAATGDNTGAVRESVGIRLMIKPREATWKMLADGASLPKFLRGIKGRAHVVVDGHAEEVQIAYLSGKEMREMALSGEVFDLPEVFMAIEREEIEVILSGQQATPGDRLVEAGRTVSGGQADPDPETALEGEATVYLTIDEAITEGVLTGSADTIKRVLRRDVQKGRPNVPEVIVIDGARKYEKDALITWQKSRKAGDENEPVRIERGA